jgi:phosphate/sulfate permease
LDSAPPPASPPNDPPPYVYAPSDIYPVGERERELCAKADHPDWIYLGGLLALDIGSMFANSKLTGSSSESVRMIGPASIGFSFGATIGGGYLALPKCEPHWVTYAPREGYVRSTWPIAVTLAMVGGVLGTSMAAISTTNAALPLEVQSWSTEERAARLWIAGGFGVIGALVPYILPPQTWRAANELARIRATADAHGAYVRYSLSF